MGIDDLLEDHTERVNKIKRLIDYQEKNSKSATSSEDASYIKGYIQALNDVLELFD